MGDHCRDNCLVSTGTKLLTKPILNHHWFHTHISTSYLVTVLVEIDSLWPKAPFLTGLTVIQGSAIWYSLFIPKLQRLNVSFLGIHKLFHPHFIIDLINHSCWSWSKKVTSYGFGDLSQKCVTVPSQCFNEFWLVIDKMNTSTFRWIFGAEKEEPPPPPWKSVGILFGIVLTLPYPNKLIELYMYCADNSSGDRYWTCYHL